MSFIKLKPVMPRGPRVTKKDESQSISYSCGDEHVSRKCSACQKDDVPMSRCKRCHAGSYCSRTCQKKCWSDHKSLCDNIVKLESQIKEKAFANLNFVSKTSKLTPKDEIKLVNLVGQKCTVAC